MSADPRGPEIPQTILVTGGRAWSDFSRLTKALDEVTGQARGPVRLLVGDCPTGADQQARIWARRRGVPAEVFRARWDEMATEGKPRKAAGPLRNLELLDALDQAAGDRLVFAFHDDLEHSRGTRQCVAAARRRGYDVTLVGREPRVEILEREGTAAPGSLRGAALDYARHGVPVVPLHYPVERLRPHVPPVGCSCRAPDCQRIGKHPMAALVPHGVKDASSDPAVVADWWARYPQANVGLATGFKFDVLDVDGPEGAAWLRRFAGEHGVRVDGPLVRTGSGGWHYYLAPTGLHCPSLWDHDAGKELGHLDWRGQGGLVVAPPSIHATGLSYRFIRILDAPLREVPPALRALLNSPARRPERPSAPGTRPAGLGHPYAAAALDSECQRVATTPPGSHQRNKTLYKASLRLHSYVAGGLLDSAEVERRLLEAARACGLAERRAIQSIQNAARVARDHPKGVPDRPVPPSRSRRVDRDEQDSRARWRPQERERLPDR